MPNTNPSDLDREALKAALGAWTWQMSYTSGEIEENLQSAIEAYLAALPRASGVPEAELRESFNAGVAWQKEMEPPPVAAPSGAPKAWLHTLRMELGQTDERLTFSPENPFGIRGKAYSQSFEVTSDPLYLDPPSPIASEPKAKQCGHDWHIWPETDGQEQKCSKCGAYRKTPIASEPKDAGSGEGQMTRDEQAKAVDTAGWSHPIRPSTYEFVDALNAHGFAIVRTAPSGAKP